MRQHLLYTLGTEEYKERVTHNTLAKYGFFTMYGEQNAQAYSLALERADGRMYNQACIDSSKTHGYIDPFR